MPSIDVSADKPPHVIVLLLPTPHRSTANRQPANGYRIHLLPAVNHKERVDLMLDQSLSFFNQAYCHCLWLLEDYWL